MSYDSTATGPPTIGDVEEAGCGGGGMLRPAFQRRPRVR